MYEYNLYFSKYKLREYEKHLAISEFENRFPEIRNKNVTDKKIEFAVNTLLDEQKLKKLTFFSEIIYNNAQSRKTRFVPNQVVFESLKNLPFQILESELLHQIKPNSSREIRYLSHSFHEYKGRFYPQLAKSFMNYANLKSGETVLDPFCGSGTTLVESILFGVNAVGIDINPIAYLLAKSKIRSLFISTEELVKLKNYCNEIEKKYMAGNAFNFNEYEAYLDIEYLINWFPLKNLKKILFLLTEFELQNNEDIKLLLKVTLSNLFREFSFQDPSQLRIRRRKNIPPENLFERFKYYLNTHILTLDKFRRLNSFNLNTKVDIFLGDSRNLCHETHLDKDSIDIAITSPPYATALPYVDTDRLSLFVFGFTNKHSFKNLEKRLIGNREITKKSREELDLELERNFTKSILPKEIIKLLEQIYTLNKNSNVGFRRKNTAALLFKYFLDMNKTMEQINYVLKDKKYFFIVVGNNRTIAGGQEIKIPTDDFIGYIAKKNGFDLIKKINMTVQKSYLIHSKNSINTESILVLRKN